MPITQMIFASLLGITCYFHGPRYRCVGEQVVTTLEVSIFPPYDESVCCGTVELYDLHTGELLDVWDRSFIPLSEAFAVTLTFTPSQSGRIYYLAVWRGGCIDGDCFGPDEIVASMPLWTDITE